MSRLFLLALIGLVSFPQLLMAATPATAVDTQTIISAPDDEWLSHGRDYREQRFSPLDQINQQNVQRLGLAWFFDTDFNRGLEASPLVADGVIYLTGNWSLVYALDARTGKLLWKFDPQVPRESGKLACCDVVNRGVALYQGKVFVGTLDARLIALDAASGEKVWEVDTAAGEPWPYTITGAPRAAKGKVYIGNGGAEYGVRGFVSAYDVNSGEMAWRFYTVPGNPANGFESEAMAKAAATWNGEWWKYGGGGTVWDSIVYDPEFDQLLIGVGNASPWNRRVRSPGGGDNLYLSSIVALDPDTGAYKWHYQETPGECWDYTASQQIMLADMRINGEPRKVIWHAPKNGFFFVIDRRDGKLLSAEPYAEVTWASGYDLATGRPKETPNADYADGPQWLSPSPMGAHNWQPMAFHPGTGLVYIPVIQGRHLYGNDEHFKYKPGQWNTAVNMDQGTLDNDLLAQAVVPRAYSAGLLAWDPVAQKPRWKVPLSLPWNGGVLATKGGLVFQGNSDSEMAGYAADSGEKLWHFETQDRVIAPPVSYSVDGVQYVTVLVGWGGGYGLAAGLEPGRFPSHSRVLTFKLDGNIELPPLPPEPVYPEPPKPATDDEETLAKGRLLFVNYCTVCHGGDVVSNGRIPDLRRLPPALYENWDAIVLGGMMTKAGMVGFSDVLSQDDSSAIKAYVLTQAQADWNLRQQPEWWVAIKRWFYDKLAPIMLWLASLQG